MNLVEGLPNIKKYYNIPLFRKFSYSYFTLTYLYFFFIHGNVQLTFKTLKTFTITKKNKNLFSVGIWHIKKIPILQGNNKITRYMYSTISYFL